MNRFFTLLLAASCLTAVGQVPDYVPTDGLVGWWSFDGNTQDASDNEIDLIQIGDVHFESDRFGNTESAITFNGIDGESRVEFPDFGLIDGWSQGTISFWINVMQHDVTGHYFGFDNMFSVRQRHGVNTQFMIALLGGTRRVRVHLDGGLPNSGDLVSQQSLDIGNWHLVTVTFDGVGGIQHIYIDGELDSSLSSGASITSLESPDMLAFGFYDGVGSGSSSSLMDEVGLWSKALSAIEVQSLFSFAGPVQGCADESACNYDSTAMVDDGSCLFAPSVTLQTMVELSSSNELQVSVPQGLSSWSWSDEVQDSTRNIQPFQEYVLNGFVGEIPEIGEVFEGGVVFAIDTMAKTAFVATSEPVGPGSEWGCKTTTTGATSTAFGAGQTNTQIILDACEESDCAARIAHSVGPEWYLPSRDELEAIRVRLHDNGLASYSMNNTYNWYWSSTECLTNGTAATDIQFSDGSIIECNNKDSNPGGVIAVKNSPINFCSYTDTLRIELDGDPLCGIGTIWDDISQTCIVANPSDSNFDGCVQLGDLLDLLTAYGDCAADGPQWQCGDPLEYQGYDYETVQIGEQCWFAENLRAENYRNGDVILANLSNSEWSTTISGAVAVYGEDSGCASWSPVISDCNPEESLSAYGRLYNWYAVDDARALCPSNWHVPTDGEWIEMEISLGMNVSTANSEGWRGTNEGTQLKASWGWFDGGNGTNSSGFSGMPGGNRSISGEFQSAGRDGDWWTSSASGTLSWDRDLNFEQDGVGRQKNYRRHGFSVRCLKDAE